jgi:hypothetical protein
MGFTLAQVRDATIALAQDKFWRDKHVPLEKVVERLGAMPEPLTIRTTWDKGDSPDSIDTSAMFNPFEV